MPALNSEVLSGMLHLPTLVQAKRYLAEAGARNPGPWINHSRCAATTARAIAGHHPDLDPDAAYVLGLLHDVGRGAGGAGVADIRHILDGHAFLRGEGYPDAARICLTHSFPIKQVDAFASRWECPPEEKQFVQDYLDHTEYTPYDRLIQLCDSLALPTGPCVLEKRLVDVALRHGFNDLTLAKWRSFVAIRDEFNAATGGSIYRLLEGVVETTFGW